MTYDMIYDSEFGDAVFEDVAFDNNRSVTI